MITSAYSKSSNSSGFNSILQKFYEIICEIIVSKMVCRIFLIFFRSSFINNFILKNNFSKPYNHRNLNISRNISLKKIPQTVLKTISAQTTDLGLIFFRKKLILYFFQVQLLNFNVILKTCFKNLFG